mmetsp:Transcript_3282/g.4904  ORF Transcript_3282/g.4904 Transcript_3282/m.4904 type:complete len:87 (-) Transcript_3282:583-843(-)
MTKQGRAIFKASVDFGNGKTLPFMPCKKGYMPRNTKTGEFQVACPLHNELRKSRLNKEKNKCRPGEVDVQDVFGSKYELMAAEMII